MKQVILVSDGQYRLVRYEPSGDARIEREQDDLHSNWLTAEDVDKVRSEPWLMRSMAGSSEQRDDSAPPLQGGARSGEAVRHRASH